jgi:hypothetical protein
MPGGIRAMLAIYRAMLTDAEQNRQAAGAGSGRAVVQARSVDGGTAGAQKRRGVVVHHDVVLPCPCS